MKRIIVSVLLFTIALTFSAHADVFPIISSSVETLKKQTEDTIAGIDNCKLEIDCMEIRQDEVTYQYLVYDNESSGRFTLDFKFKDENVDKIKQVIYLFPCEEDKTTEHNLFSHATSIASLGSLVPALYLYGATEDEAKTAVDLLDCYYTGFFRDKTFYLENIKGQTFSLYYLEKDNMDFIVITVVLRE